MSLSKNSSSPDGGADAAGGAPTIASIIPTGGGGASPSSMNSGPADGIAAFSTVEPIDSMVISESADGVVRGIVAAGGSDTSYSAVAAFVEGGLICLDKMVERNLAAFSV